MLEITKTTEMKAQQYCHYLTVRHGTMPISMLFVIVGSDLMFFDLQIIFFAEIVRNTEYFSNFILAKHGVIVILLIISLKIT